MKWVGLNSLNPVPQVLQMGIVANVTLVFLPRTLSAPAPKAVVLWTTSRIFFADVELSMRPISISMSCAFVASRGVASQIPPSTMSRSLPNSSVNIFSSVVWLPFTWCSRGANRLRCSCFDQERSRSTISSSVNTLRGLSH